MLTQSSDCSTNFAPKVRMKEEEEDNTLGEMGGGRGEEAPNPFKTSPEPI